MERQQALLHGDLHTGSLMVTEASTHAIDAEFACVGPIAFDVGKMVANLLIAYFASSGLEKACGGPSRMEQRRWLLAVRVNCPTGAPAAWPWSLHVLAFHMLHKDHALRG